MILGVVLIIHPLAEHFVTVHYRVSRAISGGVVHDGITVETQRAERNPSRRTSAVRNPGSIEDS